MGEMFGRSGFKVYIAHTVDEAVGLIPTLKEEDCVIAILDGDLGSGEGTRDGKVIAHALRKEIEGITIIAHSGQIGAIDWADHRFDKLSCSPKELIKFVKEITRYDNSTRIKQGDN